MSKGIKTRNGGRWTEAYFFGQFRQALRKMSMFWRTGDDYLKSIRRTNEGEGRHKFEYPCDNCCWWFKREDIELDHKIPCGSLRSFSDLQGFVERMFIEADGWNALCHECHKMKTDRERAK